MAGAALICAGCVRLREFYEEGRLRVYGGAMSFVELYDFYAGTEPLCWTWPHRSPLRLGFLLSRAVPLRPRFFLAPAFDSGQRDFGLRHFLQGSGPAPPFVSALPGDTRGPALIPKPKRRAIIGK